MDYIEQTFALNTDNMYRSNIKCWKRYIDDIFLIWAANVIDFHSFATYLNSIQTHLTFTSTVHKSSIAFLDLNINHDNSMLYTSLHRKPTEKNTLLSYQSQHPRALKDGLPFGQFLRVRRNCTFKADYMREAEVLRAKLVTRGYPNRLVKKSFKRTWHCPREELLKTRDKPNLNKIVCVTTFDTHTNQVRKLIMKNWNIIQSIDPTIDTPLFAYKRGKNLKDHLVKSATDIPTNRSNTLITAWGLPKVKGHHKCGNCVCCDFTFNTNTFEHGNIKHNLQLFSDCNTKNVIYCIWCPCGLTYIGQTQQPVKARIGQHRSRIL